MSLAEVDPESGCRIALIRREELDADGQNAFDFYTQRMTLRFRCSECRFLSISCLLPGCMRTQRHC
jgi:hypothetical protein